MSDSSALRRTNDPATNQLQDAIDSTLRRQLPEWVRGSVLLGPLNVTLAVTFTVAHRLGQMHRGWFVARIVSASDAAGVVEIPTNDVDYKPALANTHLQLRSNQDSRVWIVAF